jgi:predicted SpoU family rRNA methylase
VKTREELAKALNAFCVATPSGGCHFYFKYDSEIKQTKNEKTKMDIRSDNGYACCPPSVINGVAYEIINNVPITEFNESVKKFLREVSGDYYFNTKKNTKETKREIKINQHGHMIRINEEQIREIIGKLKVDNQDKKEDYRGSYQKWSLVLKFCKMAGNYYEIFDEWSKGTIHKNYDEIKNYSIWNKSDASIYNFWHILKITNTKNIYTYKKINDKDLYKNKTPINKAKFTSDLIEDDKNYLVKSDTGTGKTTAFRNYIFNKKNKTPFISICSRVMLCNEQHRGFIEANNNKNGEQITNLNFRHYEDRRFEYGDCIFITPESSPIIHSYDFSKYIIFIDEFDSVITHVMESDTCRKRRKKIFKTLLKMIAECKQFICVDADISITSKNLLDSVRDDYVFYVNEFKNYKGKKVTIINNELEFLELIKGQQKYMIASDSINLVDIWYERLRDVHGDLKKITSEDEIDRNFKLDDFIKIIFSPKIIYGLDSVIPRHVFCIFSGDSISPSAMVQQIARSRNIEQVYIFIVNRTTKKNKYESVNDVIDEYEGLYEINRSIYNKKLKKFPF